MIDAHASRADETARDIEKSVMSGEFRTDDFIGTKDDLQKKYNIARGTLNEAIRLLKSRSIIKVRPGVKGGIFVAETSPLMKFGNMLLRLQGTSAFAEDCLKTKDALDPAVSIDAAMHRTPADVADLFAIIDDMARGAPDPTQGVQLHWRLHRRIGQITPNIVLRNLYLCLMDVLNEELVEVISQFKKIDHRMEVHIRLVEAIAAGDTGAASYWGGERHRFSFGARTGIDEPGQPLKRTGQAGGA
jgi:DNA-binding FadR family transcriptional regulator